MPFSTYTDGQVLKSGSLSNDFTQTLTDNEYIELVNISGARNGIVMPGSFSTSYYTGSFAIQGIYNGIQSMKLLGAYSGIITPAIQGMNPLFGQFNNSMDKVLYNWNWATINTIDECNNSSVDATLWTNMGSSNCGSIWESTTGLTVAAQNGYWRLQLNQQITVGRTFYWQTSTQTNPGNDTKYSIGIWAGSGNPSGVQEAFGAGGLLKVVRTDTNTLTSWINGSFYQTVDITGWNGSGGSLLFLLSTGTSSSGTGYYQAIRVHAITESGAGAYVTTSYTGNSGTNYYTGSNAKFNQLPTSGQTVFYGTKLFASGLSSSGGVFVWGLSMKGYISPLQNQ